MHATITTPARRIVRTARSYRPGFRLYFDADGQLTDAIYGPEAFGPARDTYAVRVNPAITQQQAADALDDYATAREAMADAHIYGDLDLVTGVAADIRESGRRMTAADMR